MLAVPRAAASAMNQTTGVERTAARASGRTGVCMAPTLRSRVATVLAENGHDGGGCAKTGPPPRGGGPVLFRSVGAEYLSRAAEAPVVVRRAAEAVQVHLAVAAGQAGTAPAPAGCWSPAAARYPAAVRRAVPVESGPADRP